VNADGGERYWGEALVKETVSRRINEEDPVTLFKMEKKNPRRSGLEEEKKKRKKKKNN